MCMYMHHIHHHILPKYKIYVVGLPSVLYETRGHNKRSVLNQLFWLPFRCFHVLFMTCATFHTKNADYKKTYKTRSICVYTCTIYIYMHHMHCQIPPKYNIYLVGLPSVLYKTPGHNKRSVLNQLFWLPFRCFHVLFMTCATFHTKNATLQENLQN